jgi:anti-sigma B factor antagonist
MAADSPPNPRRTLSIEVVPSGDRTVTLVCRGRITSETSDAFKSQVKSLAPGHLYIFADLADVDYVDSSGLGAVLTAFLSARATGCELKLVKVQRHVSDLLDMTRLSQVFEGDIPT